jgi:carbon monoxide dehydrogenase subunit G
MVVTFGPKKVSFKGRATTEFDFDALTGSVHGRGSADMRAARIGVKVNFTLRADETASTPTTIVRIVSDAELGGVLADFARTGGVAVANVIMADFARRAAAEFAQDDIAKTQDDIAKTGSRPADVSSVPMEHGPAGAAGQLPASVPVSQPIAAAGPIPASEPIPLAVHVLLWAVIKAQFARFVRWLPFAR